MSLKDIEIFFEALEELNLANSRVLLMGDFNISNLVFSEVNDGRSRALRYFLSASDFFQCNNVLNDFGRLLDLVISDNKLEITHDSSPMVKEDVHHPALAFDYILDKICRVNFAIRTEADAYDFRKANFPGLYHDLETVDWQFLTAFEDIDSACTAFYAKIYNIFDVHVPKFKQNRSRFPPWFTNEIKSNIKRKKLLHDRYRRFGFEVDHQAFRQLRTSIKKQVRDAYSAYLRSVENSVINDPKTFWKFFYNKKGKTRIGSVLRDQDGLIYDSPDQIVTGFSRQFSSIFTAHADVSAGDPYLSEALTGRDIKIDNFSENELLLASSKLKNKMTAGPDGIPSFLVRDCSRVFVVPLLTLFNLSLSTSRFPTCWRRARVCPVLKSGDPAEMQNYRPISLISCFAKIFEMSLYARIFPSLHSFISQDQHGFFTGRSTVTNLVSFTQRVTEVMDGGGQMDVVYTDFSKAFDRIDHGIILRKLRSFGFSQPLCGLFQTYLADRQYYVSYGGHSSAPYIGTSGVPQGSNLGPLLFLLFINDLTDQIHCSKLLYADDLKLFSKVASLEDSVFLQQQLSSLETWCQINRLPLNITKCKVMTYTRKKSPVVYPYELGMTVLERARDIKDLGVTFDSHLVFDRHIEQIISKSLRMLGFIIRNTSCFRDLTAIKLLYFTYVRSRLEYADVVWAPYYETYKTEIEKVQRKFLKYIFFRKHGYYPIRGYDQELLLHEFDMLPLETRRMLSGLTFLYKLCNQKIDSPDLMSLLNFREQRESTRRIQLFNCPRAKTNLMLKSPVYVMLSRFNKISHLCDLFNNSLDSVLAVAISNM